MKILSDTIVKKLFFDSFNAHATHVVKAPGRVNLIGEHTDYNDGFVLPIAINYYTYIAIAPRAERKLHVIAKDYGDEWMVVDLDQPIRNAGVSHWSNYILGVIQELLKRGFKLAGGQLLITGNVPIGAGLSSSASLEIALIRALTDLSREPIEPAEAALIGQAAENNFVGCQCGIMDQLVSALGQENSALLIDCKDLTTRAVAIPEELSILIVHSGIKRGLVDSEYNQRRQQCEAAAAYFGAATLREVTLDQLLAAEDKLDPLIFRRARHVLTENARTLLTADALRAGDLPTLIQAMSESHISMRDDFNITTPGIDRLVEILSVAGAGLAGVRMTGGGFGGCVVAMGAASVMSDMVASVEHYQNKTGCVPTVIPAKAIAGAFF